MIRPAEGEVGDVVVQRTAERVVELRNHHPTEDHPTKAGDEMVLVLS
jgi:hypothetical protein